MPKRQKNPKEVAEEVLNANIRTEMIEKWGQDKNFINEWSFHSELRPNWFHSQPTASNLHIFCSNLYYNETVVRIGLLWYPELSHAGQNYWMLIGWERGHFFLNQERTFGNQEGIITWCWLAEPACINLVSCFKRILKRKFRNAPLLSLILKRSFHLNAKENQHATKRSLLVEKQKDFSDQKRIDLQPENSLSGDSWCSTKH